MPSQKNALSPCRQIPPSAQPSWLTFSTRDFVVRVLATGTSAVPPNLPSPHGPVIQPGTEYWSAAGRTLSDHSHDAMTLTVEHREITESGVQHFFANTGPIFAGAQTPTRDHWVEVALQFQCVGRLYRAIGARSPVGIEFLFDAATGRAAVSWYSPNPEMTNYYAWNGPAPADWTAVPSGLVLEVDPKSRDWYQFTQQA